MINKRIISAVMAIVISMSFMACSQTGEKTPQVTEKKAVQAPDFELKDREGNTVKLSDFRGKKVILNCWASWCPPCKAEMPEFEELNQELKKVNEQEGSEDKQQEENEILKNVVLLTVNLTTSQGETKAKANRYIDENNYTMTVLYDAEGIVGEEYKIYSIPSTFLIDEQGNIITTFQKMLTREEIYKGLEAME